MKIWELESKLAKKLIAIGYSFGNRVYLKVNSPFYTDDRSKANETYKNLIKQGWKIKTKRKNEVVLIKEFKAEGRYGGHVTMVAEVKISKVGERYRYSFWTDKKV